MQAQKFDAETGLNAHTAAYRVLQAFCQTVSDAEAIKAVFAEHGGNAVRPCVFCSVSTEHVLLNALKDAPLCSKSTNHQPCCCLHSLQVPRDGASSIVLLCRQ